MVQSFGDSCIDTGCWGDSFDVSYHQDAPGRSVSIQPVLVKNRCCSGNNLSEGERWRWSMIKAPFSILENLKLAIYELKKIRQERQAIDDKLDDLIKDCDCGDIDELDYPPGLDMVCNYSDHQRRISRWRKSN